MCRQEEIPAIAALQASAFFEPIPIAGPFNKVIQYGFEVRSEKVPLHHNNFVLQS